MPLQRIINFQGCATGVEDINDPATGELGARAFVVVDPEEGTTYRCVMDLDSAKRIGQQLMGIGHVAVMGPAGMSEELKKEIHSRNHRSKR